MQHSRYWVNLNEPQVIDNTRIWDEDFPKEAVYMPVNMNGDMKDEELADACDWWLNNVSGCVVVPVFKDQDLEESAISVDYRLGHDLMGTPMLSPLYPAKPTAENFEGWRIIMTFCHGWTSDSGSDSDSERDSDPEVISI